MICAKNRKRWSIELGSRSMQKNYGNVPALLDWYQAACNVVLRNCDACFTPEMMWAKLRVECPLERQKEMLERPRAGKPVLRFFGVAARRKMKKYEGFSYWLPGKWGPIMGYKEK